MVSNALRYDPLLAHYLASELDSRLRGRETVAAPFFAPDLSVTLPLDRGELLRADLHPTRGWIRILSDPLADDLEADATCAGVSAPADERLLRIELQEGGRFRSQRRTLFLELHTNQWNAILVGEDGRIVSVLRPRRAGDRSLYPGEQYRSPERPERFGADSVEEAEAFQVWTAELDHLPPKPRRVRLLERFAWTGTVNARWILGDSWELEESFARWWWLRGLPAPKPSLLLTAGRSQPYPLSLAGAASQGMPTLLAAMDTAAEVTVVGAVEPEEDPRLARAAALAQERLAAIERKLERLTAELASAGEAERLRSLGDLLLARLHLVPRGAAVVTIEDWDGSDLDLTLDPRLTPAENAARYYDLAGRRQRAEEQIPTLIRAVREDREEWREAIRQIEQGEVPERVARLLNQGVARRPATDQRASLPYRIFQTSGGLEVRVGRSSGDNDRLTFHASAPDDVWLHARSVPGSHVILRWPHADSPPARDLAEAAQLAAVFSRARTSGTVAVDWTRRKHVRKPRGAAPGSVVPQRVRTLFVEPDEAVVERLARRE